MTIEEELITFIQSSVVKDSNIAISSETELFASKTLDSMNILNIIGFVEKRLQRKLTDDELMMKNFATPKKIVEVFFE